MSDDRVDQRVRSPGLVGDPPEPGPRQVWESVHPRDPHRRRLVRIDRINSDGGVAFAECHAWYDGEPEPARATTIRVDRLVWRPEGDGFRYLYTLPVEVPEAPAGGEVWLSTGQAAAVLGVDASTVFRMAERGVLPHQRGRNGYRKYRLVDVEQHREQLEAQ